MRSSQEGVFQKRGREKEMPEVIRLYVREGERMVKDLGTGMRTTQVNQVFEGAIDEFILAYLKTQEASDAWERREMRAG